jgi:alpha-glucosidase (family GH31 glycosyl hydrolase)
VADDRVVPRTPRGARTRDGVAMRRVAGIAAALALLAPASAAADQSVGAGSLEARIAPEPWHLDFVQDEGGPTLSEARSTGGGPAGTLGFRTPLGWFHATRVAGEGFEGEAYRAELETTDPLGRRIEVRIEPAGEGAVRVAAGVTGVLTADVTAVGIGFEAHAGERYLGFGERSNAVDQRGNTVESYVADGPYQSEEYPVLTPFVPAPGLRPRDDATYFPMPWVLSTAGYGVLVENNETSYFRLGSDDPSAWSLEAEAGELAFRVFAGPTPADVLRRLTEFTGRQPPPAAPWFLGPWHQPTSRDEHAQAQMLREGDVPGSAVNTYTHYLPCGDHEGNEQGQVDRAAGFHALGYAVTTYFNPMVCESYSEVFDTAASQGYLTEDQLGQPYLYRYTGSEPFLVGQFDFSAPGASEYYGELLSEAVSHGYDGWMEDFGEYTPLDSRSANGMSGEQMHNLYPVLYHCASWEFAREQQRPVAGFIRSGWTGVHPCAQLVWGGDPTTEWGFDGIESAVRQGLTLGTSGISRWGSAVGGFFALGFRRLTTEMLIRWIQLGAVSGIMRTEANGFAVPPKTRPQITDPDVLGIWRRYAKLRTQLYPYLAAAEAEYQRSGLPVMRHLALVFPGDPEAVARDDEFMFGPDLLAAPVVRPETTERSVYLPEGRWVDFWRAVSYREADGSLRLGAATTLKGRDDVTLNAALDRLPLLARAGAVIPLLPASVDTLAGYSQEGRATDGVVGLEDVAGRLELLAFPRGNTTSSLGESGGARSREMRRGWRLRLAGVRGTRFSLSASLTTLQNPFAPCRVLINGKRLRHKRWSYDRGAHVLEARFKARRKVTRLYVRRGGCPKK